MALYRLAVGGQGPLEMQLGTTGTRAVLVKEIHASGESTSGTTSVPTVTRPSVLGLGTSIFTTSIDSTGMSAVPVITSFSSAPSLPTAVGSLWDLPASLHKVFPEGSELVVPQNSGILLYASTAGGHTWTGEFAWEEL